MLGLKINYHKSEPYIFDRTEEQGVRIANILNCRLSSLPLKYLGIPISEGKLRIPDLTSVTSEKMAKRIHPWKGENMSSRGRLILSNSCLACLPTYTMGFYLLPRGIHRKMNSIRSKFYWRGASEDFKYHMVKWEVVCRPKEFRGLGLINTLIFNEYLMTK
jgi:hypothetical protein